MKISPRDLETFLRAPLRVSGVLLYGADAGQVRQRVVQITQQWLGAASDALARTEISGEELAADPARLSDELAAMSLMAPRRVILLREPGDSALPSITSALAARSADNFLIVYVTESLAANSKLRQWAERAGDIACLPFYKDEGAGLEGFIRDTLRGYGLRADAAVLRTLAAQLSGDRQIIVNELEKLSLYLGDEAESVPPEVVGSVVGENNDLSFDALNAAVAGGDVVMTCRLVDRLLAEGHHGLVLVRSLMRMLQRLEQIVLRRDAGEPVERILDTLRPPVFFKLRPQLSAHSARWPAAACAEALARLQALELECKRLGDDAAPVLAHALLSLAQLPASARRAA